MRQTASQEKRKEASPIPTQNNYRFGDFVHRIYPKELEIKDTTYTDMSASYLDLPFTIDSKGRLRTKLYDKRDDFHFSIPEHTRFIVGSCYSIFSFICMFCGSLFVILSFFFIYGFCLPLITSIKASYYRNVSYTLSSIYTFIS